MGGWPEGRPRRPAGSGAAGGVILAVAASVLAGAVAAQTFPDCPAPRLTVAQAERGLLVIRLEAPCAPYAPVTLTLGPLSVDEETGIDGSLSAALPPVAGAGELVAQVGETRVSAPLPERTAAPFGAIIWPGSGAWGALSGGAAPLRLGFPRPGTAPVDLVLAGGDLRIEAPVTDALCGRRVEALLLTDGRPDPVPLTLVLPDCAAVGQRVSIPLPR